MKRTEIAALMVQRLEPLRDTLRAEFARPGRIRSCVIDELLPPELASEISQRFPQPTELTHRATLREDKYVSAQLNQHDPIIEELTFAFQEPPVVSLVSEITGLKELFPDAQLYAGGISAMPRGCFLNPHLDNSHDADKKNYRVVNLLYYVSPNWEESHGGNLELWDDGIAHPPRVVVSRFNRLVLMGTHKSSLHSVNPVRHEGVRLCVSNYYFSPRSPETEEYFHATSFRGRPEQKATDLLLRADSALRTAILKVVPYRSFHIYKR